MVALQLMAMDEALELIESKGVTVVRNVQLITLDVLQNLTGKLVEIEDLFGA